MFRIGLFLALFGIASLLFAGPKTATRPQQLVFESMGSLPDGTRVGIFIPGTPVSLGLQSKSGPTVLTIGEILHCKPFDEEIEAYRKEADGTFAPATSHRELLNCGPMVPGGADRILAVVGIQWNQ